MEDLGKLYAEYNKLYFGGELPVIPVCWGRTSPGTAAEFWPGQDMRIVIHPTIKRCGLDKYTKILLLHECAHVKLRNRRIKDHGRVWQKEMQRLALIGAFDELW